MLEAQFYLMHLNDPVCALSVDLTSGAFRRIMRPENPELLPPAGMKGPDMLRRWWQRRAVPITQGRIRFLLREMGLATPQEYLVKNLGLSLSDHYWIKPIESDVEWDDVNLFTNDFTDATVKDGVAHGYSPSSSTQGDLQKFWIIDNGKRQLVKGNWGSNSQNSLNEVFATLLHEKQGKQPFCAYAHYQTKKMAHIHCICDCWTSAAIEFIPAIDVIESTKQKCAVSDYEHFINVCVQNGLTESHVRSFLEYQILTDFILTNTDRHLNNFGVLRDTNTLKFVSMAPLFDSGNSMFWDNPLLPEKSLLKDVEINSFYKTEAKMLEQVHDRTNVNLSKLPSVDELIGIYSQDPLIVKPELLAKGYNQKVHML